MLRCSRTLPLTRFFKYSAWPMAVLTVVQAGEGVAALPLGRRRLAPL